MKQFLNRTLLLLAAVLMLAVHSYGQNMVVSLDMLDGMEITQNNIFNFQVINNSGATQHVQVTGTLRYRNSQLRMGYTFNTSIAPGVNIFSKEKASGVNWTFSETALRELFFNYNKLPQGTYEYCVALRINGQGNESQQGPPVDGCLYNTSNDIFLINLVSPENNAKLSEQYPMLSWMVNYPFASALTYKIRVAEQKKGQNPQNAITRNPAMYQDNSIMGTNVVYPVTAKPLEKWQPYVWTVDAYYKGILLGGAEVWKFMIVDDSILKALPHESFYVDITKEKDQVTYYAVGKIKIKYVLDEKVQENLKIVLKDKNGNEIKLKMKELNAVLGDNRYEIDLKEQSLKHLDKYQVVVTNTSNEQFIIPITYINPDFL